MAGETIPPDRQHPDWRSPDYDMLAWRPALPVEAPGGEPLRTFDPRIFTTAFRGFWIRHPSANAQQSLWFQTEWQCDGVPDEAWLRIAANRNYEIFVNGRRGYTVPPFDAGLETGEWIFNNLRNFDPPTPPEILDPQESIQAFGQQRFEAPRNQVEDLREPLGPYRPKELTSSYDSQWAPKALSRDLGRAGFNAFNLAGLLHPGRNTIAIRLDRLVLSDPAVWPGQVAVDGEVSYADGRRGCLVSDGAWSSREGGAALHSSVSAIAMRAARAAEETLPVLKYQGVPSPRDSLPAWTIPAALAASLALLVVAGLLTIVRLVFRRREGGVRMGLRPSPVAVAAALLRDALVPFTVVLGTVILLRAALGERSEQLWFLRPDTWRWSLCAATVLGLCAGLRAIAGPVRKGLAAEDRRRGLVCRPRTPPRSSVVVCDCRPSLVGIVSTGLRLGLPGRGRG